MGWLDRFIFTPGPSAPGGPYASRPQAGNAGALYYADEGGVWRDDGSQWRPMIGTVQGYQPPAASAFTALNQGTSTIADSNGALLITGAGGDSGTVFRGYHVALDGTTTDRIECAMAPIPFVHAGAAYPECGIFLYESGTGKMVSASYQLQCNGDGGKETQIVMYKWTGTSAPASGDGFAVHHDGNAPLFLRLRRNPLASNVLAEYSRDRQTWSLFDSASAPFTTAPDRGGIWTASYNTAAVALVPHLRISH